jgi:hypothetical protein
LHKNKAEHTIILNIVSFFVIFFLNKIKVIIPQQIISGIKKTLLLFIAYPKINNKEYHIDTFFIKSAVSIATPKGENPCAKHTRDEKKAINGTSSFLGFIFIFEYSKIF